MGVVWRALDTTLGREVAIKLLPAAVSADAERLARFEREARLLASLNHQNIATIHGLHSDAATHFLVMELVEGEGLEQRIERAPLPLERAIEIATQVAAALEAAHAQGVVHRDLKPANVKLAASGDAKVLDFGLAKAFDVDAVSGEAARSQSLSPTLTSAGTVAGVILGTAAYMAPEQARGKPVDKRADLWAFGCVLYEMLARRRCFAGETISDTLAAVLKEEPDWSALPDDTPPAIRRLLRRCLVKDPRNRLADAADARLELQEALDPQDAVAAAPAGASRASRLPWIVAAVAVVAALGSVMLGRGSAPGPARPPVVLSIPMPGDLSLNEDQEQLLELSPDGRSLVFGGFAADSPASSLYLRKLDDASLTVLPGTESALNPFFSPDGQWVGFFVDGKVMKLQLGAATPITVADMPGTPRGATWSDDDRMIFPAHFQGGLMQVDAAGGQLEPLTQLDVERRERTHRWPQAVPGHDVVLFTVATDDSPEFYDDAHIDAVRLSTGERKTVFEGASFARYVPTGHLVLARGGFLYAVSFDIASLETKGTPQPVVEGVTGAANSGVVYASIAANGLLAYVPGRPEGPRNRLTWLYEDGTEEPLPGAGPGGYIDPALSPDGKRVAVALAGDRTRDIWIFDLEHESRARLTFEGENTTPVWLPDGKSLIFYSVRSGLGSAWITAADGSGEPRPLRSIAGSSLGVLDVSKDGGLALLEFYGDQKTDLYVLPLDDPDADLIPFVDTPADERHPRFSPDDRWVAYTSDETGDYEVFVRPYPGPAGRWQISAGGIDPHWSPDGRRIHYRNNRTWWVVDVDPGDGKGRSFRTGTPRLVRKDLPRASLQWTYTLSRAGDAILLAVPEGDRLVSTEIRVVVDWLDEVKRLVR